MIDIAILYTQYAPLLRHYLAARVPQGVDPEDIVQDVFVRVLVGNYEERGYLRAWLFQIAKARLIDIRKSAYVRRCIPLGEGVSIESPERAVIDRATQHWVRVQIRTHLQGQQREIIWMRFVEGRTTADVAATLSLSILAVKATQHRAVVRLRQAIIAE